MPPSPSSSEVSLSIRTSCNRCRAQKLKCVVSEAPSNTASCQRCARAMVPCIFGRRERKRRTSPSDVASSASWRPSSPEPLGNVLQAPTTLPLYPSTPDEAFGISEPVVLSAAEAFPCYDDGVPMSAEHSVSENHDTMMNQLGLFSQPYQDDSVLGELEHYDYSMCRPSLNQHHVHTSRQNHASLSSTNDWVSDFNEYDTFAGIVSSSKPQPSSTTLLHFAATLHERLEALENAPSWRRQNARLDDYPIGSVLQLSNKFQSLGISLQKDDSSDESSSSGRFRHSRCSSRVVCEYHLPGSDPVPTPRSTTSSTISASRFEPSVSLILLSCYVTLLRISTAVLGHFQDYLQAQPSSRPRASSTSATQSGVVCLGDLVPLNQSHDRINTAIYMLLSSLEQVEEALCLPPQVRHASALRFIQDTSDQASETSDSTVLSQHSLEPVLTHWGLLSTTGGIQDILLELGRKVNETKDMLRHHMDL